MTVILTEKTAFGFPGAVLFVQFLGFFLHCVDVNGCLGDHWALLSTQGLRQGPKPSMPSPSVASSPPASATSHWAALPWLHSLED